VKTKYEKNIARSSSAANSITINSLIVLGDGRTTSQSASQSTSQSAPIKDPGSRVSRQTKETDDELQQHMNIIKCLFVYSYVWSFGGHISDR